MYFSGRRPEDVPPPPTADELARAFTVAVMTFAPQSALEELGSGMTGSSSNGGPTTMETVSLSYTLWRNPGDHTDPANLAALSPEAQASLDVEPPLPLPDWMLYRRERLRYPSLWEAVMTTLVQPDRDWQTPETTLVEHTNHILHNTFRDERVVGGFPGELDSPVTWRHLQRVPVSVDGQSIDGLQIDTDPHVYAVGADLGDRIVTAVIPRENLALLDVAFVTRPLG
jgi:hypothetical protein